MNKMKQLFVLFATACAITPAMAHEAHKHQASGKDAHAGHEQHAAHEHGVAALAIAVGDAGVEMVLESPAVNVLGFEHSPKTDAEKQKLAEAKKKLEAGTELFALNNDAGCELKDTSIDLKAGKDGHSDMEVTWAYACSKPAELKAVEVKLFGAFPNGFQKIKAEWVTEKGASRQELDKDGTVTLQQ